MPRKTLARAPKHIGRPTGLGDTDRINLLLELLRGGNHVRTSCTNVGIGLSSYFQWQSKGADAHEALTAARALADADGRPHPAPSTVLTNYQLRCMHFADQVAQARSVAEVDMIGSIGKVIHGGYLISRKPALTGDGTPIYTDTGELAYEEVYAQPDGKLALEFLSRSAPDRWGRQGPLQVEVSGPGGGAMQVEQPVLVKALAERLASTLALPVGSAAGDEPVDAEVVEDDDAD